MLNVCVWHPHQGHESEFILRVDKYDTCTLAQDSTAKHRLAHNRSVSVPFVTLTSQPGHVHLSPASLTRNTRTVISQLLSVVLGGEG